MTIGCLFLKEFINLRFFTLKYFIVSITKLSNLNFINSKLTRLSICKIKYFIYIPHKKGLDFFKFYLKNIKSNYKSGTYIIIFEARWH